jgi:hypothetical protein
MRIILDAPDQDDQPTPAQVVEAVRTLMSSDVVPVIGVNDAGHGNVLIDRLRRDGIPCERWFRASCGLRKKKEE